MYSATGDEPTKLIALTFWSSSRASTETLFPFTTFKTPFGKPASIASSANIIGQVGSFSDGFKTKVFPQAIATGYIHIGTIAGKLNGVIPAQTPIGCLILKESTLVPTFAEWSPFNNSGIPMANSTTSIPLCTDPFASGIVFPCSCETAFAKFSWFLISKSLYLDKILDLAIGVVLDHVTWAFTELFIANFVVSISASSTSAICSPVAGLKTGDVSNFEFV